MRIALLMILVLLTTTPELSDYMQRVARERDFSGAVLVAEKGELLLNQGYGLADEEAQIPVTADTVFDIGSISKQFTATAILHLEQRGLLTVQDTLAQHLPDVPADKEAITLHQLLTHTAGFAEDHFVDDLTPMTGEEALAAIYVLPLEWEPGTHYSYSNSGYTLLALVVQEVGGQPFTDYLHQHLFAPAGMESTGFYSEAQWEGQQVASTYLGGEPQGNPARWPGPYWGVLGNGGVLSTTGDMYRWIQALQQETVLTATQVEKLFTPHVPEEVGGDVYYAYGWTVEETEQGTLIQHNGGGIGGNSHLALYPEAELAIIVTSNHISDRWPREYLPATETAIQLAGNIFSRDFSTLPPARFLIYPYLVGLGAVVLLVIGVLLWRRSR